MEEREQELLAEIDRLKRMMLASNPFLCGNMKCGNRVKPTVCPCCGYVITK
jgi:hypothetical protein